jgi:hypothetical protein
VLGTALQVPSSWIWLKAAHAARYAHGYRLGFTALLELTARNPPLPAMRAACSPLGVAKGTLPRTKSYRFPDIDHRLAGPVPPCAPVLASCGLTYPWAFSLAGLGFTLARRLGCARWVQERRLTIHSSRTCFVPAKAWHKKLATLSPPLRKSA